MPSVYQQQVRKSVFLFFATAYVNHKSGRRLVSPELYLERKVLCEFHPGVGANAAVQEPLPHHLSDE